METFIQTMKIQRMSPSTAENAAYVLKYNIKFTLNAKI